MEPKRKNENSKAETTTTKKEEEEISRSTSTSSSSNKNSGTWALWDDKIIEMPWNEKENKEIEELIHFTLFGERVGKRRLPAFVQITSFADDPHK